MNRKKEVHDWKEERAQERLMLLAPLLVESMEKGNTEISFWIEKIRDRKNNGLPIDAENY